VKVEIFNVTGQRVRELVNTTQDAGEYRVIWDGVNDGGLKVGSGLYFCRMASGSFVSVKKMLLVK
jgi:flagellar hook assembly protein FlgD